MVCTYSTQKVLILTKTKKATDHENEPETNWERISNRFEQSKEAANILLECERKAEAKEVITLEIRALLKDLEEAIKESDAKWIAWAILEFTRWRASNLVFIVHHAFEVKFVNGIPFKMAHSLAGVFKRQANYMNEQATRMLAHAKQLETIR